MKIHKVLCSPGLTGFYMDDKKAIQEGAAQDGFIYLGEPLTPGFRSIRQPGESVSVMLLAADGAMAYGDCAVAQYASTGGRELHLDAASLMRVIETEVAPYLEGRELSNFRRESEAFDQLHLNGRQLPASIRYGVTQAILEAVAKSRRLTMAEVVAEEYGLPLTALPVRINAQCGDDRYVNVDKMILKQAGMIPQGLINNVEQKFGKEGEIFLAYAAWVRDRVLRLGPPGYRPAFRFDLYGCAGKAFRGDLDRVVQYLLAVEEACRPIETFIEMPVDLGTMDEQLAGMIYLQGQLKKRGSQLGLIIDEYANTLEEIKIWADRGGADMIQVKTIDLGGINNVVEAVLYCKERGVRAYQGGTCNETDKSARVCVHLAIAAQPFAMGAKPGMGVDEGMMIVHNEQERVLAVLRARRNGII